MSTDLPTYRTAVLALSLIMAGSSPRAHASDPSNPQKVAPPPHVGVLRSGPHNAITDVAGVAVGHVTLIEGDGVRTGVTAILPHAGNVFQDKVPGAVFVANGFGKLAGSTQVQELGAIETPVVLTNTLSVAAGIEGLIEHTLTQPGNEAVGSVNALVGETNDGQLNDIRARVVSPGHVRGAIAAAVTGPVPQGNVGAGTGTVCFGFKGGIGSASRRLPAALGGYTVGVLVQANFGGVLRINGVPVGEALGRYSYRDQLTADADGSCMIVVATDAPLDARNLERLAKRAFMGLARTGGIASNGSGDYVVAFSTAASVRVPHQPATPTHHVELLHNAEISPLFLAAIEAAEQAIVHALWYADDMTGRSGQLIRALPLEKVVPLLGVNEQDAPD